MISPFTLPDELEIQVPDHELARLMSWPMNRPFHGPTLELVTEARAMFAEHAQSLAAFGGSAQSSGLTPPTLLLPGVAITGKEPAQQFAKVQTHAAVVLAATAGHEIMQFTGSLWESDQGDVAFALASLCSAYVEQSLRKMHESLCHTAAEHELAVLNPCSPGNEGLDFESQHGLFKIVAEDVARSETKTLSPALSQGTTRLSSSKSGRGSELSSVLMPIEILDSGALNPTASVFAICGITKHLDLAQSTPGYRPCGKCAKRGCSYRRSPYLDLAV